MTVENKINFHNCFDIEVRDKDTGELKQAVKSYNIVTDRMFERLCGLNVNFFRDIVFGRGTGELDPTRTTLFDQIDYKEAVTTEIVRALPTSRWQRRIILNPEEFVGEEITEVGIGFYTSASSLVRGIHTHSLLKDSEGNNVSILKTDQDAVTIYATLFVTFDFNTPDIRLTSLSTNLLHRYLVGARENTSWSGGSFISANPPRFYLNEVPHINYDSTVFTSEELNYTGDTANKQIAVNYRVQTDEGNGGHIKNVYIEDSFMIDLPAEDVFPGQPYAGVVMGTGDGEQTVFSLPSRNVRRESLSVRVNNLETTAYELEEVPTHHRRYRSYLNNGNECMVLSRDGKVSVSGYDTASINYLTVVKWDEDNYRFVDHSTIESNSGNRLRMNVNSALGISGDGTTCAFAATGVNGHIQVADWDGEEWVNRPDIPTPDGISSGRAPRGVALDDTGTRMVVGFSIADKGGIFVFDWDGSTWAPTPMPEDMPTALNVDISADGNTIVHGGNSTSFNSYVFDWTGSEWVPRTTSFQGEVMNIREAHLANNGDTLLAQMRSISGDLSQHVYVSDWDGTEWVPRPVVRTDYTGVSINVKRLAISEDGKTVVIGGDDGDNHSNEYHIWTKLGWEAHQGIPFRYASSSTSNMGRFPGVSPNGEHIIFGGTTGHIDSWYAFNTYKTNVTFNSPPDSGVSIEADYTVDGVHKTDQYVMDIGVTIQLGEGV